MKNVLILSASLYDADFSYKMSLRSDNYHTTIGIHPTRANEPFKFITDIDDADNKTKEELLDIYFDKMKVFIEKRHIVKFLAIGECGLDYERLFCADEEI